MSRWTRRLFALGLCFGAVAVQATGRKQPAKKRAGPAAVEPVVMGGLRFEVLLAGKARGRGQNGGDIVAYDTTTGAEQWILRVYEIHYTDRIEPDKQDVYITRLCAAADGRTLGVEDERGRRWRVDVPTRTVSAGAD